jgi:5-methylcytosine-specific restriction protein A
MARSVPEWIGRTDDSMPGRNVRDRLSRDQGDCCAICRHPFGPKRRAHCDHIVPLADEGENRGSNLQMICADCHKAKTSVEATARAKTRDIRASHIMAPDSRSKWQSPRFRPAKPQLTASSRINKFSPIDGVFEIEDQA